MIGVVAIGRNEGARLEACLSSVRRLGLPAVYVDSGSTDGSVALAEGMGVAVVHLDTSRGFTAARARNAGFDRLMHEHPGLAFVQFVDGDCTMSPNWPTAASQRLMSEPGLAAVAGRLREVSPEATIFNRMCDMEWHAPPGETSAVGGIAMYRVEAFEAVGRFNPALICGEEPELCFRLRSAGWRIERLVDEMARHDAAMTRWSQWWKRNTRGGWAYAEGAAMHGRSAERYNVREARSIVFWAGLVPVIAAVLFALGLSAAGADWRWGDLRLWPLPVGALTALILAYPLLAWRIARWRRGVFGDPPDHALLYGVLTVLGKWPQLVGMARYVWTRWWGREARLIEYKGGGAGAGRSTAD